MWSIIDRVNLKVNPKLHLLTGKVSFQIYEGYLSKIYIIDLCKIVNYFLVWYGAGHITKGIYQLSWPSTLAVGQLPGYYSSQTRIGK